MTSTFEAPEATPQVELMPCADSNSIGVYVHFPWCLKKCPYCDFLSVPKEKSELPHRGYATAIIEELSQRAALFEGRKLHSIFFGGGTPSLWATEELGRVLESIKSQFQTAEEVEVTAECNPGSLSLAKANALASVGVNRLSIGVQSLSDAQLRFLGRWHSAREGLAAVEAAASSKIERVSADVIYGVHGQSPEQAAAEVSELCQLGLTHISAYSLTIEPGTRFGAQHKVGRLPLLSESATIGSFEAVHDALEQQGFRHYEISNFCKPGAASIHNSGYWRGHDYLGLGCGAWGTLTRTQDGVRQGLRYRNTLVPERYLASDDWPAPNLASKSAGLHVEKLTPENLLTERLMLGLRMDSGISPEQLETDLGINVLTPARQRCAAQLEARGRLNIDNDRWTIPTNAWLFADDTISKLV